MSEETIQMHPRIAKLLEQYEKMPLEQEEKKEALMWCVNFLKTSQRILDEKHMTETATLCVSSGALLIIQFICFIRP